MNVARYTRHRTDATGFQQVRIHATFGETGKTLCGLPLDRGTWVPTELDADCKRCIKSMEAELSRDSL